MTENSCGTITTDGLTNIDEIAGSIGRPLPGTEVKIVDANTQEDLPADEVGELCTRGYMQFLGKLVIIFICYQFIQNHVIMLQHVFDVAAVLVTI